MSKQLFHAKIFLTGFLLLCAFAGVSQVTLTATSGTTTGSFTTLKGAFDAINAGTHKGAIVIKINANTTETASASLTASAALATSAPYYTSINIYPTVTGLSITGALAAPLINLSGADSVTIDGRVNATGSTKSLTISNTSAVATAGTSTIRFIADASSNTVKYCTLKGSTTDAAAGIVFFSTATTTGNDNNKITNNDITCAADGSRPLNAVYALGTSAKSNNNDTISNNNIYDFLSKTTASQGVSVSSNNTAFAISGNSFYETASFSPSAAVNYNVILISAATGTGNGFTVSDNYIGGSAALCADTAWTKPVQNNAFTAISVTTATGTANSIQNNTIQNFDWTNAGTSDFTGISIAGATVANIGTTTGNTIGAATGTGSIIFTSNTTATDFFGISIASTDVVDCRNNTIGSVTVANAGTNATNFFGIVKTATAGTTTISSNMIGSTTASSINASSASSTAANIQSVYGIQSAGTGVITISGNTVANLVNATSNATTTAAGLISGIYVSGGTNTISDNTVRNLSIANTNTSITNTASVSGIVMASTTATAQTVSGNTVYNLSNSNASFAGGVIGIYYAGPTTASTVRGNFIHSLSVTGASSTTADLYGIKINAGATTYSNNIISLGGDTKTDLFGIYQTGAASNNNNFFYNTVYIGGSLVTGATNTSYALYSTGILNTRDFRNNIFTNARSTVSGASKHYAMYIAASGGTITCNYNNYFVSGTGGVLGYFAADKTALPIVTSNDANSIVTNPTFSSAGGTTATDYTPTVPGTAVTGTGITLDYAGNTRATNVTMGAFEVKLGPDVPTDVVATAGVGSASIAFTAPTNVGGGAISNYQYSLDNGSSWVTPSPAITASPLIIAGLVNCTAYSTKIRAVNATGGGTASSTLTVTPQNGQGSGIKWTIRTSVTNNGWYSVTYGNGLFVAVAYSGTGNRVMTSPDGITWTSRTTPVDNNWSSVTYGNGLFVAVASSGTGNRVMTSPDGITWTSRTTPVDNDWSSVTYGNGLFVAVANTGTGNRVMTSDNGINWTSRTTPVDNSWYSVTYGNGLFVAVANSGTGNRVMTSDNGINWTSRTTPVDNDWYSVTYGNGLFVAVAYSGTGNRVMTSPDGINWTSRTTPVDNGWLSVTYGKGLFVAVANTGTGNRVMTSDNGINWTSRTSAANNSWFSVTYGNGLFVAVAYSGINNQVMTSSDFFAPSSPNINNITTRNTYASVAFTVPSSAGSTAITNYEYSIDNGSTWVTPSTALTTSPFTIRGLTSGTTYPIQLRAVNSAGSGCGSTAVSATTIIPIAPNEPTNVVATAGVNAANITFTTPSNDGGADITGYEYSINNGSSWTAIAITSSPLYISGLTACTNYTIKIRAVNAAGGGTASAAVSVTPQNGNQPGINWTIRTTPVDNSWYSVTYGNGLFVAVAGSGTGTGNRVMTSPDGITWTSRTSAADNSWYSVTYGNGLFVAVGFGAVMTSPDGITWTSRTSAAVNTWYSVTYGNGLFVAVAYGAVMTSPDGITWTSRTSAADISWYSVTYGNGLFVAVANTGTGNRVMTSPDGITWTSRTSAANNSWVSVTYGNGLFVAVATTGTGNRVMTSDNGINWTSRTTPVDNSWYSVTYGNGLFVAVANSGTGNRVMTSDNGINWTSRTTPVDNSWYSVTYGNGLFVAVANTGTNNRVMTSSDLFAPSSPNINNITTRNTYATVAFTAPTSSGYSAITNYQYSTDNGSTWVTPSSAVTASPLTIRGLTSGTTYPIQLRAVNSAGSGCGSTAVSATTIIPIAPNEPTNVVATAGVNAANIAFTTPTNDGGADITGYEYSINNGSSWTAIASTISPLYISGLTACTNYTIKIRAVNAAGGGTASAAVSFTPQYGIQLGINWTSIYSPTSNSWTRVTYGNGLFVALAPSGTGNQVMTSPDGITWTSRTTPVDNNWQGVTYGNGLFVAVSTSGTGNRVMTSPDGITWTSRTTLVDNNWQDVTYGNGLFVAVSWNGTGNRVMTSPDGITWTSRTTPVDNSWQGVTYGNGLFVAVATSGTGNRVMTSPDGITWTSRTSAADIYWKCVTYGNGLFVAVAYYGTGNKVMTSPDGITWTSRTIPEDNSWYSVTYGNGLFVAVATSGTVNRVMTSPDGTTWTIRTTPVNNGLFSVTYGNGLFVAVAASNTGNLVMTSSDLFAPGSPSINSITPSNTTASVAFTAPASAGSTAITNYKYSTDNGSTWLTRSPVSTASPLIISNLSYGSTYQVQLRAVNSAGSGCESSTVSTTIPSVCSNPTAGGTIASAQSGTSPFNPSAFTSSVTASGNSGTLEYKWQSSTTSNSAGFSDIASSNADTYDAGALTVTTWYKRLARVDCKSDWIGAMESNVLEVTVISCSNPTLGGTISAAQSGINPFTPSAFTSSVAVSGQTGIIEYKWQSSTSSNTTGFSDIASSNAATYTPGALTVTTWFKRLARVTCSGDWSGAAESNVLEVTVTSCTNPTAGGTIAAAQSGISPFDPAAFTSSSAASGHTGTLEYKWQSSTTSSSTGFSDIASSNAATYNVGSLIQTTWFKRLARVSCKSDWSGAAESNVLEVTVIVLDPEPLAQPTNLFFTNSGASAPYNINLNYTASATAAGYLVVRKTFAAPSFVPADGSTYSAGAQGSDTILYVGSATSVADLAVNNLVDYHYRIYAFNGSGASINYLTVNPLGGKAIVKPSNSEPVASTSQSVSAGFPGAGVNITFPNGTPGSTITAAKTNSAPAANFSVLPGVRGVVNQYFTITSTNASVGTYTLTLDFSSLDLRPNSKWDSFKILKRADANAPWVDITTLGATILNRQTDGVWGKFTITGLSSFSDFTGGAEAATAIVRNISDDVLVEGSLRYAIANATAGDFIRFDTTAMGGKTIYLGSPVVIDKDLTIMGANGGITLNGNHATRVMDISDAVVVRLDRLKIENGSGNSGLAGGIWNNGNLTMVNCVVSGNSETGETGVGGILQFSDTGDNPDDVLNLINCTVTGNTGFAYVNDNGIGGLSVPNGTASIYNTIIYGNTGDGSSDVDITTAITLVDHSDIGNLDSLTVTTNTANISSDPGFAGAANAAHPFAITGSSPAADAGSNSACLETTDIRGGGFARKLNKTDGTAGIIDMGAYEFGVCINPTSGGTIATAQSGINPFNPAAFTSSTAASGQTGTLEYKWQLSTTSASAGFSDIASSNAATYDVGALTATTWYKRLARVTCSADWTGAAESNVLEITVSAAPTNGPVCDTYTNQTTANGLAGNTVNGVYASGSTVYAATTAGGLSISTDGGATFTNKTFSDGLGNSTVRGVYASGITVYAATSGGLSISTDGGATFTNKTTSNGLGSNIVQGVYAIGSTVYAATSGGLSISTDGGATFTNKTTSNGLGSNTVRGVHAIGSIVYVATIGGLSISTDGGATFTNNTTTNGLGGNVVFGVYAYGSMVYAATSGGLSISTDGGITFTNRTTANGLAVDAVQSVYASGSTVYAATGGGLGISTDGGTTFINMTTTNGLGTNVVKSVFATGSTIYAGTDGGLSFCSPRACTPPTTGGTIATAQSGVTPFNPAAFTSTSAATGQTGTLEYKWQLSTTSASAGFSDIASSNAASYDAGALTATTWFKRLARVDCSADWTGAAESNVLEITVTALNTWTGATSNNFNTGTNWSYGTAPTASDNFTITTGNPQLNVDYTVGGTMIISGTGTLTINAGKTLSVGALGTADFGGKAVTIKSDATGTGAIGQIAGTLTGATNVTVERYIATAKRAWRFLTVPVTGTTLRNAWAGVSANATAPSGETAGSGTLITGHGIASGATASAAGFDWFAGLNTVTTSSIRYYSTAANWSSASNTPSLLSTPDKNGYMLFVRGDRTVTSGSSTTTLKPTGTLKTGTQTISVGNAYEVIGNPYASSIDLDAVYNNSGNNAVINRNFWVWDATLGTSGAYRAISWNGSSSYDMVGGSGSASDYLKVQSGQAFFVEMNTTGGNITIEEANKTGNASVVLLGAQPVSTVGKLAISLYQATGSTLGTEMDGVLARFGSAFQAAPTDDYDVVKISNFNENLGLLRGDRYLSIDSRPYPAKTDTLFAPFWNLTARGYALKIGSTGNNGQLQGAKLVDAFTKTETALNLNEGGTMTYTFSVTADAASSSLDRFMIVMTAPTSLPVSFTGVNATPKTTGIDVSWKTGTEVNVKDYSVERSSDGLNFTAVNSKTALNANNGAAYNYLDLQPLTGKNYYRIRSNDRGGDYRYSGIATANWNGKAGMVVYPTAVTQGRFTLQLTNQPAGNYKLALTNIAGRQVYGQSLTHAGGSGNYGVKTGSLAVGTGVYQLTITSPDGRQESFRLLITK